MTELARHAGGYNLAIQLGTLARGVKDGDSLAVDGVCLTAVAPRRGVVRFKVVPETLRKTTLSRLTRGSVVNVERSLVVGERLAGHFVQGHVQGVGRIAARRARGADVRLTVRPPARLMSFITTQASVAVHGVSLTVARLGQRDFTVALIPVTLERTNLSRLHEGDLVNIETDLIARHVIRWLERQRG